MASSRNASLKGLRVMVDAHDLQDVLDALDQAARFGHYDKLNPMLHYYNDPSNPLRLLVNNYNATMQLLATPPDGEA